MGSTSHLIDVNDQSGSPYIRDVDVSEVGYINNVISNFISGVANYIRRDMIPRSKDTIISTNEKVVEMIRNRKNIAGENWAPKFPFVVVTPNMDFMPADEHGRAFHGYQNFDGYLAAQLYKPRLYEDDDLFIAPVLNRYKGTIDTTIWCSSFNELIDLKFRIIQMFGGENRPIYPETFQVMVIIPDYIENYTYKNDYTEVVKTIDWSSSIAETVLVKNINKNKLCVPYTIRPYLTLRGINDNSDMNGGSGNTLSDHRLNINLEWECSLPVHFALIAKKGPNISHPLMFELDLKFTYISDPNMPNEVLTIPEDISLTSHTGVTGASTKQVDITIDEIKNYIITSENQTSFGNREIIYIDPSKTIEDIRFIKIYGKYGALEKFVHYDIFENTIKLYGFNLQTLREDDILVFVFYKEEEYT